MAVAGVTSAFRQDLSADALGERVACARRMLSCCQMCERCCGCDRTAGQTGFCGLGEQTRLFHEQISIGDDSPWIPSLRIYLAGCEFRCRFCITAPTSFDVSAGTLVDPSRMAERLLRAIDEGIHGIVVYGGEPTLHAHTLLAITAAAGRPLPFVLNTNGYMTPELIDLLDGVVSGWVVDFKFGNDSCAQGLANVSRYTSVLTRNLLLLASGHNLHIRHLLIPGHLDCCFRPIVQWLCTHLPETRFSLMTGYVPHFVARQDGTLSRLNDRALVRTASELLSVSPLAWDIDPRTPGEGNNRDGRAPSPPAVKGERFMTVTLGVDGRVYFHDVPPEIASITAELCPSQPAVSERPACVPDCEAEP